MTEHGSRKYVRLIRDHQDPCDATLLSGLRSCCGNYSLLLDCHHCEVCCTRNASKPWRFSRGKLVAMPSTFRMPVEHVVGICRVDSIESICSKIAF